MLKYQEILSVSYTICPNFVKKTYRNNKFIVYQRLFQYFTISETRFKEKHFVNDHHW